MGTSAWLRRAASISVPERIASRIEYRADELKDVQPVAVRPGDWSTYCGDNGRSFRSDVALPESAVVRWSATATPGMIPTAPVTAGEFVFVGDRSGTLRAWHAASGELRWQAFTGGPLFGAPAVEQGRVFVGAGDGRVYAFEAATGRPLWRFAPRRPNAGFPCTGS